MWPGKKTGKYIKNITNPLTFLGMHHLDVERKRHATAMKFSAVHNMYIFTRFHSHSLDVLQTMILNFTAQPLVTAPPVHTAALGDSVSMVCDARGYPAPDITWFRKDGEMPE